MQQSHRKGGRPPAVPADPVEVDADSGGQGGWEVEVGVISVQVRVLPTSTSST